MPAFSVPLRSTPKAGGISPVFFDGTVFVDNAEYVLVCKTLYTDLIDPNGFVDKALDEKNYSQKDYHKVYVAEIEKVLKK